VHDVIGYQTSRSSAGEITNPDITRRGLMVSTITGLTALAAVRLSGKTGENWYHKTIRPPGAIAEDDFLNRCIKCSQCMRICPTNVIQPAGIDGGLEGLWTPVLNNRIGSSGCQLNCIACGQVCPTAAIRPITIAEKLGEGEFAERGPVKLGTAFVDRDRCLPWAMDKPCIVCQENCPVSPKAIYISEVYRTIRDGVLKVERSDKENVYFEGSKLEVNKVSSGDFYCMVEGEDKSQLRQIVANGADSITVGGEKPFGQIAKGTKVFIQVRLQRPCIDIEKCIGCGVCEHECPVSGKRAIRVSAEGESRSMDRSLLLGG